MPPSIGRRPVPFLEDMLKPKDIQDELAWRNRILFHSVDRFFDLYLMADRYLIESLKTKVCDSLENCLNVMRMDAWFKLEKLTSEVAVETGPLHAVLLRIATDRAKDWTKEQEFKDYLVAHGEFAAELLCAVVDKD